MATKNLSDYAGIWAHMPEKEWKSFERKVAEARKGIKFKTLSKKDLLNIKAGLNDLKRGRVYSSKRVSKMLGTDRKG